MEPRRREAPGGRARWATTRSRSSRSPTGSTRDGNELIDELERLYVPKNDPRWLRRNALVALGNVGRPGDEHHVASAVHDPDDSAPRRGRACGSRIAERSE